PGRDAAGPRLRIPPPLPNRGRGLPEYRHALATPGPAPRLGRIHVPVAQDPPVAGAVFPAGRAGGQPLLVGPAVLPVHAGGPARLLPGLLADRLDAAPPPVPEAAAADRHVHRHERRPAGGVLALAARPPERGLEAHRAAGGG